MTQTAGKILVVDDDPRLRELVRVALEGAGYGVLTAADGRAALTHEGRESPDLVVLDVGLPEADGFEVCRRIRARSDVPVLFLTAHDDEVDRILGLELGADDYVTKPFSPRELVARIRAILKRTSGVSERAVLRRAKLSLDNNSHRCAVGDRPVSLTATEFALMSQIMRAPNQVHTRVQLVDALWGDGSDIADRTLDSHLRNLRKKLSDAGCGDAIETVHGVGIRLGPCAA
ncbi:response regulator [Rhodobacterales bacterium HKCCE2091]|nr:response regulator [Rhodobacterales bacterium HKCCE2091]